MTGALYAVLATVVAAILFAISRVFKSRGIAQGRKEQHAIEDEERAIEEKVKDEVAADLATLIAKKTKVDEEVAISSESIDKNTALSFLDRMDALRKGGK